MIFRIIDDATGEIVINLDYPDDRIPRLYLRPGQSLFSSPEEAPLQVNGDKVCLNGGRLDRRQQGPLMEGAVEPAGVGEVPTYIMTEGTFDAEH